MKIPDFATKEQLFKHLKENKALLILSKKSATKEGDSYCGALPVLEKGEFESKDMAVTTDALPTGKIRVKAVINTSNLMDSHCDVHIGNIWKRSLSQTKYIVHLESHDREFKKVIADSPDVTAYVKTLSWKSLGYDYEGSTNALIFDSVITAKRNDFMYNQYREGFVKNHSVGMQYVNMFLCLNSEEKYYAEEKEAWDKYYPMIANKEAAEENGYFWAVTEAKLIEGSAVVLPSNTITPTLETQDIDEPGKSTSSKQVQRDPLDDTPNFIHRRLI